MLMLITIYECKCFYIYILSLVFFIIEIIPVLLDFTGKKNLYIYNFIFFGGGGKSML